MDVSFLGTEPAVSLPIAIPIMSLTFSCSSASQEAGVEVDPLGDLNTESERKLGQLVLLRSITTKTPAFPLNLFFLAFLLCMTVAFFRYGAPPNGGIGV
ncbi:hypothetical protein BC332_33991 [Capsicum chinense]|nr:hypothetical protein BC332_33991 [Capsicum chinense]